VTGWQAPVIRSAAGLTSFLDRQLLLPAAPHFEPARGVAIAFLLVDPQQLFEPSFQLSFLAVGFLGALAAPFIDRTSGPLLRGLGRLGEIERDGECLRASLNSGSRSGCWPKQFSLDSVASATLPVSSHHSRPDRTLSLRTDIDVRRRSNGTRPANGHLPSIVYRFPASARTRLSFRRWGSGPDWLVAVVTGWSLPAKAASWLLAISKWTVHTHARWEPNWRIPGPPIWLAVGLTAALIGLACAQRGFASMARSSNSIVLALLAILLWAPFAPDVAAGCAGSHRDRCGPGGLDSDRVSRTAS